MKHRNAFALKLGNAISPKLFSAVMIAAFYLTPTSPLSKERNVPVYAKASI